MFLLVSVILFGGEGTSYPGEGMSCPGPVWEEGVAHKRSGMGAGAGRRYPDQRSRLEGRERGERHSDQVTLQSLFPITIPTWVWSGRREVP